MILEHTFNDSEPDLNEDQVEQCWEGKKGIVDPIHFQDGLLEGRDPSKRKGIIEQWDDFFL